MRRDARSGPASTAETLRKGPFWGAIFIAGYLPACLSPSELGRFFRILNRSSS